MKFAHYNKTTKELLGWYDSEDSTKIPKPNVEITLAVYKDALINNYNYVDLNTNTLSFKDFRDLSEIKKMRIKQMSNKCENTIYSGMEYKDRVITLTEKDQRNINSAAIVTINLNITKQPWIPNTTIDKAHVVYENDTFYVALKGGATGDAKPTFPSDFSIMIDDNGVHWYKLGLLVGTDIGNINYTPQDIYYIYTSINLFISNQRAKYMLKKSEIETATTQEEVNNVTW